jgi:hypothetical protein
MCFERVVSVTNTAIFNTQYHFKWHYAVCLICSDADLKSEQHCAYVDIGSNGEQQPWHKLHAVWWWS